jgi:hypothetical protein
MVSNTLFDVSVRLTKDSNDLMRDNSRFAESLGMLLYLAHDSRPDLSSLDGVLALFMAAPRKEHIGGH